MVMSLTLTGTFDGAVIHLDSPVDLDPNTKVRITVELVDTPARGRRFLETALQNQVTGPPDWATNMEQYLHGPLAGDE
jgi:hypothetical protein